MDFTRTLAGPFQPIRVGILGATGAVGQKFVTLLDHHPWFEVVALAASERSAGKPYEEAVHWLEPHPIPAALARRKVCSVQEPLDCQLVFSGPDAAAAREVEPAMAARGLAVVSNASAFRQDPRVPLLVPEVNAEHLELVHRQSFGGGCIVTNPNCSVVGLVMALKPLEDAFGVARVQVTTLQAVSGAGYPGVPSLDILGNVVPWIAGEEEKIEAEPRKILGRLAGGGIEPAELTISAQANRVAVLDGHTLSISVELRHQASLSQVREALAEFGNPLQPLRLPTSPERALALANAEDLPQPRRSAAAGGGMTVTVGRLRPCPILGLRLVALVHNTIRGAAGGAILNAELMLSQGLLQAPGSTWEGRWRERELTAVASPS